MAIDPSLQMRYRGLEPDPWQRDFLRSRAKEILLCCTRQGGKSTSTADKAVNAVIYRAGTLALMLSPSLRQSGELLRKAKGIYHEMTQGLSMTAYESESRLELKNGSRIVSLPGKEETVRGYSSVDLLIIDEAARVEDGLYQAVRPMLAVSGGQLIALSTPYGKRGWFHREWTEGGDSWERVKIPWQQCPRITPEFVAKERRSIPELWFRQEYECEFVETEDAVFHYDEVMTAMSDEVEAFDLDAAVMGLG